jgi:endonuclease-3
MKDSDIHVVVDYLRIKYSTFTMPIVTEWAVRKKSPFHVLISCILSLRTRDETTRQASIRLFAAADTPEAILALSEERISGLIYPVGFYKNKAKSIHSICHDIITRYSGKVPDTIEELLTLKGVGRKTANLVITLGFNKPGICVDVHVHRISNRLGYINTKNPEETEFALRNKLPAEYWIEINDLLVAYGQNVCTPIGPKCSECGITLLCDKVGVAKSR